jgi:hypothetical protein
LPQPGRKVLAGLSDDLFEVFVLGEEHLNAFPERPYSEMDVFSVGAETTSYVGWPV